MLFTLFFVMQHELAHQQICKFYGGIPKNIYFESFSFKAPCNINTNNSNYYLAQSINDAIGYGLYPIGFVIVMMYIYIMCGREENEKI